MVKDDRKFCKIIGYEAYTQRHKYIQDVIGVRIEIMISNHRPSHRNRVYRI